MKLQESKHWNVGGSTVGMHPEKKQSPSQKPTPFFMVHYSTHFPT